VSKQPEPSLFSLLSWSTIAKTVLMTVPDMFGFILEEQPKFTLVREAQVHFQLDGRSQTSNVQVRRYAPRIVARIDYETSDRDDGYQGFEPLAKYIFGFNRAKAESGSQEVSMTSPVTTSDVPRQEIAMTSPVMTTDVAGAGANLRRMEFTMPSKWTLETLPTPRDERVKLVQTPEETVAVITFNGQYPTGEGRTKKIAELLAAVKAAGLTPKDGAVPFINGYNAPVCLPYFKTNDAGIAVQ
jgi:hypothetical protein